MSRKYKPYKQNLGLLILHYEGDHSGEVFAKSWKESGEVLCFALNDLFPLSPDEKVYDKCEPALRKLAEAIQNKFAVLWVVITLDDDTNTKLSQQIASYHKDREIPHHILSIRVVKNIDNCKTHKEVETPRGKDGPPSSSTYLVREDDKDFVTHVFFNDVIMPYVDKLLTLVK